MAEEKAAVTVEVEDKFTAAFNTMDASIKKLNASIADLKKPTEETNNSFSKLTGSLGGLLAVVGGTAAIYKAYEAWSATNVAVQKLDATLQTTNNRFGISKNKIIEMADALEKTTKYGDDQVISAVSILAAYENISGEIAQRTIPAVLDLAARFDGDATQAARTLGMALESPSEGLAKLRKQGILFTETEKTRIEIMERSGNLTAAQGIILSKIENTMGGLSKVQDPLHQFHVTLEDIGKTFIQSVLPAITTFASILGSGLKIVADYKDVIGGLLAGFVAYRVSLIALTAVQTAYNTVAMIAAVAGGKWNAVLVITRSILPMIRTGLIGVNTAMGPLGWAALAIGAIVTAFVAFNGVDKSIALVSLKVKEFYVEILKAGKAVADFFGASEKSEGFKKSIEEQEQSLKKMREDIKAMDEKAAQEKAQSLETEAQKNARVVADQKNALNEMFLNQDAYTKKTLDDQKKQLEGWIQQYGHLKQEHWDYLKSKEQMDKDDAKRSLNQEMEKNQKFRQYNIDKNKEDHKTSMVQTRFEKEQFYANKDYLRDKQKEENKYTRIKDAQAKDDFYRNREYLEDKAKLDRKFALEDEKKQKQLFKRKEKLSENHTKEQTEFIMAEEKKVTDEKEAMENRKMAIEQNIGNARFVAAQDFFGQMSQLQQIKSREMFEIGKAAAIGSAVINTYEGITKTMATYPFPVSAAMAAAQAALGFAQVQQISSQSFAGGGVVNGFMGSSSGRDTVSVDARPGEMMLNSRQQKHLFDKIDGGSLGGTSSSSGDKNVTVIYNTKVYGNGDKQLKKTIEKSIKDTEKRKLQKDQFVKGRFAT